MEEKNILSSIINYLKPKAHDAIDGITSQWEESKKISEKYRLSPELEEIVQNFVMGSIGGVGKKASRLGQKYVKPKKWVTETKLGGKGKTRQDADKFFGNERDFFKNKIRSLFDDLSDVEF